MSFQLKATRLTMRPRDESDVDDYRALVVERDQRARSLERGDLMPTAENTRARITTQLAEREQTGLAFLPIVRRDEGNFIGYCGLIAGNASVDEPEIAYELLQRAHGCGYATDAARAALEAAIATGRRRLWSTVRAWNAPSLRVLEKLGFDRDHVSTPDARGEMVWMTRDLP
jgi:RimJ/RimL family protein N-acetyltransferase